MAYVPPFRRGETGAAFGPTPLGTHVYATSTGPDMAWMPQGVYAPPMPPPMPSAGAQWLPGPGTDRSAAMRDQWEEPPPLEPVDWSRKSRPTLTRSFLPADWRPPSATANAAELGVCVEDAGGQQVLPAPTTSFEDLGDALPAYVLDGLADHGISRPLAIQSQALPLVLAGHDVVGLAQTGSGKTLAFLLPAMTHMEARPAPAIIAGGPLKGRRGRDKGDARGAGRGPPEPVRPIVLILAPVRELAVQIEQEANKVLGKSWQGRHRLGLKGACVYGGTSKRDQRWMLDKGAHLLVATPGRLIDFLRERVVCLHEVTYFVLDEADRMLDMGFLGDVDSVSGQIRPERQVLFFSATWSREVQALAKGLCHEGRTPVRISAGAHAARSEETAAQGSGDERQVRAREGIVQEVVIVDGDGDWEAQEAKKKALLEAHLRRVLDADPGHKVLVFVSQKALADELSTNLWQEGFQADCMHGGRPQETRLWVLDQFRKGELRLLIVTDVLSRGIDIPSVSHVVVHDMGGIEDYVHRIGRTARGLPGSKGHALVFFEYNTKYPHLAAELIALLKASKQTVPDDLMHLAAQVERGEREIWVDPKAQWKKGWASWSGSGWNSQKRTDQSDKPGEDRQWQSSEAKSGPRESVDAWD